MYSISAQARMPYIDKSHHPHYIQGPQSHAQYLSLFYTIRYCVIDSYDCLASQYDAPQSPTRSIGNIEQVWEILQSKRQRAMGSFHFALAEGVRPVDARAPLNLKPFRFMRPKSPFLMFVVRAKMRELIPPLLFPVNLYLSIYSKENARAQQVKCLDATRMPSTQNILAVHLRSDNLSGDALS
jgi:hypothetical protein